MITSKGTAVKYIKRLWNIDAPLTATGLLMLLALAIASAGLILDPRIITGAPAWLKPAKFALSIAIYIFTLVWIFDRIPEWAKTRRVVGWVTAIVMVVELSIIDTQAWRGTTSHFNYRTPLDGVLFSIMGAAIVLQTLTSVAVAVALWRQPFADRALGWALRLGMTITIVGAFTGALMTRPTVAQLAAAHAGQAMPIIGAHTVGASDGGRGIPLVGWSADHGDLRVPHFVGLHALQVLLLFAVALRGTRFSSDARERLMLTAAGSYFALFVILLVQALSGKSLTSVDPSTIVTLTMWALTSAACVLVATARLGRHAPIRTF